MRAASKAPLSTVQLLYEYGALPGNTASCPAKSITPGRPEVLEFLLDIRAPINAVDYEHNVRGFSVQLIHGTALMHACERDTEDTDRMVEILLRRGARVDILRHGETVLDIARKYGGPRKVELLLAYWKQNRPGATQVKLEEDGL